MSGALFGFTARSDPSDGWRGGLGRLLGGPSVERLLGHGLRREERRGQLERRGPRRHDLDLGKGGGTTERGAPFIIKLHV